MNLLWKDGSTKKEKIACVLAAVGTIPIVAFIVIIALGLRQTIDIERWYWRFPPSIGVIVGMVLLGTSLFMTRKKVAPPPKKVRTPFRTRENDTFSRVSDDFTLTVMTNLNYIVESKKLGTPVDEDQIYEFLTELRDEAQKIATDLDYRNYDDFVLK